MTRTATLHAAVAHAPTAEAVSFNTTYAQLRFMGYPMAGHLARAGHTLRVFNRTAAKAAAWVAEHGGSAVASPAEAAVGADFVFACVGNDDDVRAVASGPHGAFQAMRPGSVFVDHTTTSARLRPPPICSVSTPPFPTGRQAPSRAR